jgi:hypothetical protein
MVNLSVVGGKGTSKGIGTFSKYPVRYFLAIGHVPEGLEHPVEQITERVFEITSDIFKSVACCPVNKQGVFLFVLPLKNLTFKMPLNGRAKGEPLTVTTPMTLVGHLACMLARTVP